METSTPKDGWQRTELVTSQTHKCPCNFKVIALRKPHGTMAIETRIGHTQQKCSVHIFLYLCQCQLIIIRKTFLCRKLAIPVHHIQSKYQRSGWWKLQSVLELPFLQHCWQEASEWSGGQDCHVVPPLFTGPV